MDKEYKDITEFYNAFKQALDQLGITKGTNLYIASDIKRLLRILAKEYGKRKPEDRDQALNHLVDILQQQVGEEGTLLFPVYSWSAFCSGRGFDINKTPGQVGSFQNWVMQHRKDFRRTQHPMYSFMVWGKNADYLCNLTNQDGWGKDLSPFAFLRDNQGKQLNIDIDALQGTTFFHYVERCCEVPYRHPKYFFAPYKDAEGKTEMRNYSMYVRDLDVETEIAVHNDYLMEQGIAKQTEVEGILLTYIDLAASFPIISDDIIHHHAEHSVWFKDYPFDITNPRRTPYEVGRVPDHAEVIYN